MPEIQHGTIDVDVMSGTVFVLFIDTGEKLDALEAIIHSMTLKERRDPDILNASRRRRIAAGCGMEVQDVNRLIKQFREAQKMMKMFQKTGGRGLPKMFG